MILTMRTTVAAISVALLTSCATVADREATRRGIEVGCEQFLADIEGTKDRVLSGSSNRADKYRELRQLDELASPGNWVLIAVALNRVHDGSSSNLERCREMLDLMRRRLAAEQR